jgi:hypothetical protein
MNRSIRFFSGLAVLAVLVLSSFLRANQIVLDNFNDGNSTTLYGRGEIGLTTDRDEVPAGFTIMTKRFDPLNDHTTGSGYSLKLENYLIDVYGGVYLNVTGDIVAHPYIDGSVYKDFSFFLKSSTATTDWSLEIKDWDDHKVTLALGTVPQDWTKFRFDLAGNTNICRHINVTNVKALTFIDRVKNSSGSLWIDDIVFDDLQYKDTSTADDRNRISFSDQKIYQGNQVIRVSIIPIRDSVITIKVCGSAGREEFTLPLSSQAYTSAQEHVFEWDGRDGKGTMLRNGIYFILIKVRNDAGEEKIVKPIGIFQ